MIRLWRNSDQGNKSSTKYEILLFCFWHLVLYILYVCCWLFIRHIIKYSIIVILYVNAANKAKNDVTVSKNRTVAKNISAKIITYPSTKTFIFVFQTLSHEILSVWITICQISGIRHSTMNVKCKTYMTLCPNTTLLVYNKEIHIVMDFARNTILLHISAHARSYILNIAEGMTILLNFIIFVWKYIYRSLLILIGNHYFHKY